MRAFVLIALALTLACPNGAYAAAMPGAVDLVVNGVASGDALILVSGDAVALDLDTVTKLDIDVSASAAIATYDTMKFVPLAALAPRVRYVFDAKQLTLALTVAAKGVQRIDVAQGGMTPAADISRPSTFLNYDAVESSQFGTRGFLEGDFGTGPVRFYADAGYAGSLLLSDAYVQRYDAGYRVEGDIGTFTTTGDGLVASSDLAGVVFRRSFALNPLQSSYPLPAVSGIATGPAVADVYVDGNLVRSVPLSPGPFVLQGIPSAAAPGRVTVLVRDQSGGVQQVGQNFITAASLLAKGTTDFSYAAGSDRVTGMPVADASYRLGVSSNVTLGSRVVSGPGGTVAETTGDAAYGAATFHAGYAHNGASQGYEGAVHVTYPSGAIGADVVQGATARSVPVGLAQIANPVRSASATVSQNVTRSVQVTASAQRNAFANAPSQSNETVGLQTRVGRTAVASALFEHDRTDLGKSGDQVAVQLDMPLGNGSMAVATAASSGSGISLQRSIAGPVGTGYTLSLGSLAAEAMYQIRSPQGDLTASVDRYGSSTSSYIEVSGGVAGVFGSAVGLTRRIDDSFAVVEVPGVADAPVYVDHQFAGDTDKRGTLVVNGLHAFVPTQIAIGYDQLPLDVELENVKRDIVPGVRGGALAVFPVTRLNLVQGSVVLADGSPAPAYATVVMSGGDHDQTARVDEGGAFTFERLAPGKYRLNLIGRPRQFCSARIEVPPPTGMVTKLGTIRCDPTQIAR